LRNRVCFVVDGFNLYHSVKDAQKHTGVECRWLDIRSLCDSFLSAIGDQASTDAVYYFSALAYHCEQQGPGTVARHKAFISALESTGVITSLASFKPKSIDYKCANCGHRGTLTRHEEKETDVAVASKLIELAIGDTVDTVVVVSGDTDLVPAIKTARKLSAKPVHVLFPYRRYNGAVAAVADRHFKIKPRHYEVHQFPDPVETSTGQIARPKTWG